VKTLTSRDPSVITKFKEEADLMRKFVHPNIVSLLGMRIKLQFRCSILIIHYLGVCTETEEDYDEDNAPLMILEYMPYGDLKSFLANHKYGLKLIIIAQLHIRISFFT
jgi:serine/threonine protein kinase